MKWMVRVVIAIAMVALPASAVYAQATSETNATAINTIWTLIAAFLVFFMQAGFALVEAGFTRAKNACNILTKNFMDFAWPASCSGPSASPYVRRQRAGLFGRSGFGLSAGDPSTRGGCGPLAYWLFQLVSAARPPRIVSGAVAERIKFDAYLVFTVVDQRRSSTRSPATGSGAAAGWPSSAWWTSPARPSCTRSAAGPPWRGSSCSGPGSASTCQRPQEVRAPSRATTCALATLGVFVLWFGWFGFNPGSTMAVNAPAIAHIAVTTNIGRRRGRHRARLLTAWLLLGKPDLSMILNGCLAGLVAITAPLRLRQRAVGRSSSGCSRACWWCSRCCSSTRLQHRRPGGRPVRAPRERRVRHPGRRPVRRQAPAAAIGTDARRPTACSSAAGWTQLGAQALGVVAVGRLHLRRRPRALVRDQGGHGHAGSARGGDARAWTSASTAWRPTPASRSSPTPEEEETP